MGALSSPQAVTACQAMPVMACHRVTVVTVSDKIGSCSGKVASGVHVQQLSVFSGRHLIPWGQSVSPVAVSLLLEQ